MEPLSEKNNQLREKLTRENRKYYENLFNLSLDFGEVMVKLESQKIEKVFFKKNSDDKVRHGNVTVPGPVLFHDFAYSVAPATVAISDG